MKALVGVFNQEEAPGRGLLRDREPSFHVALQRMLKGRVEHQLPSPAQPSPLLAGAGLITARCEEI